MIRIRSIKLVLAALLLAAFAVACGSSSSGGGNITPGNGGSGSSTPAAGGDSVMIKNFMFSPMALTVKAGTTVTWTNEDSVGHTVTSNPAGILKSKLLTKGDSYSVKFTKPGTYTYICDVHPYMHGTITVTG